MNKLHVAMDESDYSRRGLRLGARLAAQSGAALSLVSVVAEPARAEPRRASLAAALEEEGATAEVTVLTGDSAKDALAALLDDDQAGLCMSAHGRRPVPEMLIGSVTAGVVRRAPRPVFLCGPRYAPDRHERVETIMVCVDGSRLSEAILPHALALSARFGARLQLLQVIDVSAAAAVPRDGGHADVMESGYLHGLARRLGHEHGVEVDWEVLHGDPADAIVGYLADSHNAMLAMTTHGRSGLSQVVAGSVSHEVLHEACCPVAVYRPADRG
ncbi:Nucleotide-binding universal stress protein, UspA family [Halomonas shengliensis]|uniref:Nucleotide-binding universal stress protein, UspA family n=1 Tax=Halomonas shengliensis TaxID=419597 RepID=A0A1H0CE48_9GAMM|nr:universal stress protein [Halomonas shengliensis]SDN56140.1 Nucleotide-binding universal stress protein, UspA family [Halomonas shengliensis]